MDLNGPAMSHQDGETNKKSSSSSSDPQYGSIAKSLPAVEPATVERPVISKRRAYITVAVLCYLNLLNYMDRYTIAGVLLSIQTFFQINDSIAGLLQTETFAKGFPVTTGRQITFFLLLAPIFGYLGDRYNRKFIMIGGLTVWLVTTLISSFVTESNFWLLVFMRALVGTGEASYTTIAPTIIGDLFSGHERTIMISAFYIFIPVGSGLGYIAAATIARATGDWRWALRLNPILGVIGLLLLVLLCPEPSRGAAETHGKGVVGQSSYLEDVKYLLKNKSFVWSSLGVTAMTFMTGALAFWTPTFLSRAQVTQGTRLPCTKEPCDTSDSYIFGAVTVVTGILGVCLGTFLSRKLRDRFARADPLICAVGMLGSAPCFFLAIVLASTSIPATYVFVAIGQTLIALNWPILADILLYVVVPTRRATAEALQITACHLLGDAGSPYLLGAVSDAVSRNHPDSHNWSFLSLEYSFLICPFVGVLGGLFFLLTSLYIIKDRKAMQLLVGGPPPQLPPVPPESTLDTTTGVTGDL